ncbi:hypothetical protein F0U60_15455 [Archangium minus]|uniref:Transporter n=1 Tax=Archangium minus TaxID=83450 RepID=A0ABY9WRC2_9BACT|nr:hypothetical protein F0U60_15455 [Archangium minus]
MRMSALLVSVLSVLLLGAPAHAEASPPQDVEELFLTETADSQEQFELQATLGIQGARRNTWETMELSLLTELGLTDRLQVEASVPVQWALGGKGRGPSGSNLETGLRYALVSRADLGLVVSPGLELELPLPFSRANEPGPGLELTPSVSVAQALGAVRLHLNLALGVQVPDGEQRELELEPAVNVAITVTRGALIPLLELGFTREEEAHVWLAPGLVWRAASWFQLGLGVPARLESGGVAEVRPTLLLTGELELAEEEEPGSRRVSDDL